MDFFKLIFENRDISDNIYREIDEKFQNLIDQKEDLYDEIYEALENDKAVRHKFVDFENAWEDISTDFQENAYMIGFRDGARHILAILGVECNENDRHQAQSE